VLDDDTTSRLLEVLADAQQLGFLGPGELAPHVGHSLGFAEALGRVSPQVSPRVALDLGSGGGLPGLVLATTWPTTAWVLLDSNGRRTDFLVQAVHRLGLDDRVEVQRGRAETVARRADRRGRFDLVVARSFGSPPVVAECAAGFLCVGGHLVVSEPPPESPGPTGALQSERWPSAGLGLLGLAPAGAPVVTTQARYQVMVQTTPCPDRYPRGEGRPAKRPLF
jgi:16S rRNA (guanine527-N7)-methyltransferase